MNSSRSLAQLKNAGSHQECVLLIAAEADGAARVLGELGSVTEERFEVEWVTELSTGIERLGHGDVKAIVLDLDLSGSQGAESLKLLFQSALSVPILILSGSETEEMAKQAVRLGAQDYLLRGQADGYRLRRTVRLMIQHRAVYEAALENEIANATLNSLGEAVLRTDKDGNVTFINRLAEDLTGWLQVEAFGCPVTEVLHLIDSTTGAAVDSAVVAAMEEKRTSRAAPSTLNCTLVRRDGVECGIESRVTVVDDQAGNLIGAVILFRDVSASRAASLELSRVAQHDFLTNLPNRTLFNDRLEQAISLAERQHKQLAVLFVDLGARDCPGCSERVCIGVSDQGFSIGCSGSPDCNRDRASQSGTGTNRKRIDAGRGVRRRDAACAEVDGCTTRHRRLWHRLFEFRLSAALSSRRNKGPSILCGGDPYRPGRDDSY